MIDWIITQDKGLFLYLNGKHIDVLDPIMLVLSSYTCWSIVFILFGVGIFFYQKQYKLSSVVFYALSVLASTVFTNLLKLVVKRPRPIHEQEWVGVIHDIEEYSDAFSFFSSHAATTFCIATFALLIFRAKKYVGYVAFAWAIGVSYSRIYVAKHYPLDVMVGIIFGIFVGVLGFKMLEKYISSRKKI